MDVRLPNGQVLQNVPDGTSRAQIAQKLSANGFEVPQEWMADAQQSTPPATVLERAQAAASGVNAGVARTVGLPVDTMANIRDLGKVVASSVYGLFNREDGKPVLKEDGTPLYYEMDADGNLVPGRITPSTEIPEWLQIGDRSQDFGSGDYIIAQMNKLPGRPAENPRPDDTASRYLFAGGQSLPLSVAGGRLTPPAKNAAAPPKSPMTTSVAAGAVGSQASQLAADSGAGPAGQVLAGALAGGATVAARPAAAELTKRVFRGGEEGRQRTAQAVQDFANSGTTPSVGQATQTRRTQATESLLARTPGAAGRIVQKAEEQGRQLGTNIERLAAQLAPRASGEQAGRAIQRGVSGPGGFLERFKAQSAANYNEIDKFVPPDTKVSASNAQATLAQLATPMKGAEKTSGALINSRVSTLRDALDEDLAANSGALPYKALKDLRTMVGEEMAGAPFGGDVSSAVWKRLYAALSKDLEAAATGAGPKAKAAFDRANHYHSAGMKRIDVISSVIEKNGGPEAVFRAATGGTKEGATTLRAVMQSLPDDARKMLSASVLRRMGRATAGRQDDLGETFSTETFLTNWNSMSPQAKAVLFDRYGAGFRADMDTVARVAANLRAGSKVFQNPSGTGQAVVQTTTAATAVLSLLQGRVDIAAGIGGGVATANLTARLMTNPRFVKWLAKTTQAPPKALPALITQLEAGSQDEKELARALRESLSRAK